MTQIMKLLGSVLNQRSLNSRRAALDQQSVFYIFSGVIKIEYGRIGSENIKPLALSDKSILVKTGNLNWANEIELNADYLVRKINEQLGGNEIMDVKIVF